MEPKVYNNTSEINNQSQLKNNYMEKVGGGNEGR